MTKCHLFRPKLALILTIHCDLIYKGLNYLQLLFSFASIGSVGLAQTCLLRYASHSSKLILLFSADLSCQSQSLFGKAPLGQAPYLIAKVSVLLFSPSRSLFTKVMNFCLTKTVNLNTINQNLNKNAPFGLEKYFCSQIQPFQLMNGTNNKNMRVLNIFPILPSTKCCHNVCTK